MLGINKKIVYKHVIFIFISCVVEMIVLEAIKQ